jgi:NAD-dependent dihydropyrimidine dehydrogenase PreA subunit/nitroreductase
MIKIDLNECNSCGLCIRICHESCLRFINGTLTIDYKYCSTCTQCIAVCPQQALSWDNIKPEEFDKSLYPDSLQLAELLKERRTIRDFTKGKIDKLLLEEIAGYSIYAPTHDFNLRVIIVDDEIIIKRIDDLILKFSTNLYNRVYKPKIIHFLLKLLTPAYEFEFLKAKPKLENAIKRNKGLKSKPSAVIMIIGNKKTPLSLESAQYALYNIDLYAQTKGIAGRNLVGNQMILNRNKQFKKSLGLTSDEKIYGTIVLGYPAVMFRNKVAGKKIRIQWNGRQN